MAASGNAEGPDIPRASKPLAWLSAFLSEGCKAHLRRFMKSREVSLLRLSPGLRGATHVLVTTVHNEAARLPFVLQYYRHMGFEQFIIIDNRSDDGLQDLLRAEENVSVFFADGAFKAARFGYDWVNGVLAKFCAGKWVLYIDADEFFVFPHCDSKTIIDLTDHLASRRQVSMQCLMLDMYSGRNAADNICAVGQDPLSVCKFYDKAGYREKYIPMTRTTWIKGGVRGRIYFADDIWEGPALNKTPLVYWRRHYAYLRATHMLWPFHLNGGKPGETRLRGILLHFKFLADWTVKIANEAARRQHTEEYGAYTAVMTVQAREPGFVGPPTAEYRDWRSLARDGLLDDAAWPPPHQGRAA